MNLEAGPNPEEIETEQPVEQSRGFWGRIWGRNPEKNEQIERPDTPAELVELMSQMTAVSWRERQIQERYGGGRLGQLRAFTAGERDFEMDENGQIQQRAWRELSRKALTTVFNRRTALAAGTLGLVGIFTGGVGLPAAGALFGSMTGRGVVEAWHSLNGRERGLREEIARSQYREWSRHHETALSTQEEGIDNDTRNQRIAELVDSVHQTNEEITVREGEIIQEQGIWNRRRRIGEFLGGVAGLAAGIWSGFTELSKHAMTMNIDGDKTTHLVEKVNDAWHYVYNTTQEVVKAHIQGATLTPDAAGYATHLLGESTGQVVLHAAQNLIGRAVEVGGVVAGLYLGRLSERSSEEGAQEKYDQELAGRERNNREEREFQREQMPGPAGPEPIPPEQLQWQEQFQTREKPMPAVNQVWVIEVNGQPGVVRINGLDFGSGQANISRLNEQLQPILVDQNGQPVPPNENFSLQDILNYGTVRENFVANWARQFQPGDQIDLLGYRLLDNRGREVTNGRYQIDIDAEHNNQVILHQENQPDVQLDGFGLAFFGLNRLTPERQPQQPAQRERAPRPALRQIWHVTERDQLPPNLRDRLPEFFVIQSVNVDQEEINIYNRDDQNQRFTLTFANWPVVFGASERAGEAAQQGGGGQPRGGGGGGRRP
ncbi:MAG: hypothetical protein M1429_02230 [Patescibacteria group bacterium]|nr:hypothetical protein [Patescibacteria group bacterium]